LTSKGCSVMQQYCVVCGRPLVEGEHVGPFCVDCFVKTFKLLCVPERLVFDYCKYCGSYRDGYRWVRGGELSDVVVKYASAVLSSVRPCRSEVESYKLVFLEPLTVPSWRTIVLARYAIKLRGVDRDVEQEYRVEVRANPTICPACKDARGGDYSVVVQVRGLPPADVARSLEALLDSDDRVRESIVDIVEYRNGVDLLLLDVGSARRLVKELKKKYIAVTRVSGEDVGVTSTGKLRRRTIISVRIRRPKS
jgi:nonsense-mediated mRNA decay protein 3